MTGASWDAECDAFVRQFAERSGSWDDHPGDLEDWPDAPWTDPDHPDERLDAAYRSGMVPKAQRAAVDGWDSLTVLRAHGRRLAKRINRDGSIEGYDSARRFDLEAIPVDGIDHIEDDLRRLLHQPDRCLVRGEIADSGRARGVRRLLHPDDRDPASLVEVPRRWLALDIDDLARPANVAVADIAGCAEAAAAALPSEFRGARGIAQATASHGGKPGIRMRLWYWLDRPVCGVELRRWLRAAPVDHALFGPAQIIYTSTPIFIGRRDPLPCRIVRMSGAAAVRVPELPEPERAPEARPVKPEVGLSPYAKAALNSACRRIIAAGSGQQESVLNNEAFAIGALAAAGAIPSGIAAEALRWAARQVRSYDTRRPWHTAELDRKVGRAFADGLRHPREARHG